MYVVDWFPTLCQLAGALINTPEFLMRH
jgi:hypothetical protein